MHCSNFTLRNSVFSAVAGEDSTAVHLNGRGGTLTVNRMTFDNVMFNGFTTGLAIGEGMQLDQPIRMINCDLSDAKDDLGVHTDQTIIDRT